MGTPQLLNLLKELLLLPRETDWVELKENKSDPEEMSRMISGLSNAACIKERDKGYLIYGVEDETHKIVGTTLDLAAEKVGTELAEHWLLQRLMPRINIQIFELNVEGKKVVMIEVPAAVDRPTLANHVAYTRIGSITRPLTEFPELERIIWNNATARKFETQAAISNLTQDEALDLLDVGSFFALTGLPTTSKEEVVSLFTSEKILLPSRGGYDITNLGAILLAKKFSDFETVRRKTVRVIEYAGIDRTRTKEEKMGQKGYASAFQGIVSHVNGKLPTNEEISDALRVEKKVYPEIAIRELVANALIHQDFSLSGNGPMIEIFSDRLEITNPGRPLVSIDRLIDYPPRSRNEALASLMRRMKICEERGSGIDKVIDAVEAYQLPAPKFETYDNGTKVVLYAPKAFSQMDRNDRTRACHQHCVLNYVSNKETTNATVRKRFKIAEKNYPMASRIINDTIDAKLIKPVINEDNRKLSKYVPIWA